MPLGRNNSVGSRLGSAGSRLGSGGSIRSASGNVSLHNESNEPEVGRRPLINSDDLCSQEDREGGLQPQSEGFDQGFQLAVSALVSDQQNLVSRVSSFGEVEGLRSDEDALRSGYTCASRFGGQPLREKLKSMRKAMETAAQVSLVFSTNPLVAIATTLQAKTVSGIVALLLMAQTILSFRTVAIVRGWNGEGCVSNVTDTRRAKISSPLPNFSSVCTEAAILRADIGEDLWWAYINMTVTGLFIGVFVCCVSNRPRTAVDLLGAIAAWASITNVFPQILANYFEVRTDIVVWCFVTIVVNGTFAICLFLRWKELQAFLLVHFKIMAEDIYTLNVGDKPGQRSLLPFSWFIVVAMISAALGRLYIVRRARQLVRKDEAKYNRIWSELMSNNEERMEIDELQKLCKQLQPVDNNAWQQMCRVQMDMEYPSQHQSGKRSSVSSDWSFAFKVVPSDEQTCDDTSTQDILVPNQNIDHIYVQASFLRLIFLRKVKDLALRSNGMLPCKRSNGESRCVVCSELEAQTEFQVVWPSLKNPNRSVEKCVRSYKNDVSQLVDVTRACILFEKVGEIRQCLEEIVKDAEWSICRIKNRMSPDHDSKSTLGYRDVCLNLRVVTDVTRKFEVDLHVVELQLMLRSVFEEKTAEGHRRYVSYRNMMAA